MKTHLPKVNLDQRKWHVIDAKGAVLGRLAAQVADVLRGKNKPVYTPHLDAGDFVVVINAEKIVLTGKKESQKTYMSYSGWKGGERYRPVLMTSTVATVGMLPAALATGVGSDVQRSLATVIVGGLIVATLLTLFILPTFYFVVECFVRIRADKIATREGAPAR